MKNKISDVMTTDLISVKSTDDLLASFKKMKASNIRHLTAV